MLTLPRWGLILLCLAWLAVGLLIAQWQPARDCSSTTSPDGLTMTETCVRSWMP